jgi:hypothetical protein
MAISCSIRPGDEVHGEDQGLLGPFCPGSGSSLGNTVN